MHFLDSSTEAEVDMVQEQCQTLAACSLNDVRRGVVVLVRDKRTGEQESILVNNRSAFYLFRGKFEDLEGLSGMGEGHFHIALITATEKPFAAKPEVLWRNRLTQGDFYCKVVQYLIDRGHLHPDLSVMRHMYFYALPSKTQKLPALPPNVPATHPLTVTAPNVTQAKLVLKSKPIKPNPSLQLPSLIKKKQ